MLNSSWESINNISNPRQNATFSSSLGSDAIIQLTIYILIFVVGCIGNLLVIIYFGIKRKLRERFSHYLINLAFVDFLTSIFTPLLFVYQIATKHQWKLGLFSCISISSIGPLTVNVSAWIITSIAIERYRGITNPLLKKYSCTQIYMTMCFIWIVSVGTLVPYMMSMQVKDDKCEPFWSNPDTEFAYSVVLLILQSILPSFMMIFMFVNIHKAVSERTQLLSANYKSPGTLCILKQTSLDTKSVLEKRDEKLFNMLTTALVVFIVCSIPYNIFYTIIIYLLNVRQGRPTKSIRNTNVWLAMLVTINSCMNFFIYAGLNRSFKHFCKSLLCHGEHTKRNPHISFQTRMSLFSDTETRRGSNFLFFRKNSMTTPQLG